MRDGAAPETVTVNRGGERGSASQAGEFCRPATLQADSAALKLFAPPGHEVKLTTFPSVHRNSSPDQGRVKTDGHPHGGPAGAHLEGGRSR